MRQSIRNEINVLYIFFIWLGRRGNLFANLRRVVMEGSRGLSKRLERQYEGSWTDLKNFCYSCSRLSARLGMAAQYNACLLYTSDAADE